MYHGGHNKTKLNKTKETWPAPSALQVKGRAPLSSKYAFTDNPAAAPNCPKKKEKKSFEKSFFFFALFLR